LNFLDSIFLLNVKVLPVHGGLRQTARQSVSAGQADIVLVIADAPLLTREEQYRRDVELIKLPLVSPAH
jgi:hypothetical protein